jgi:hypothetical protein
VNLWRTGTRFIALNVIKSTTNDEDEKRIEHTYLGYGTHH